MPTCVECGYFGRDKSEQVLENYEKGLYKIAECFFRPPLPVDGRWKYTEVKATSPACGMFYQRGEKPPKITKIALLMESV